MAAVRGWPASGPLWAGSASTGSPAPGWSPPTATAGSRPRTLTACGYHLTSSAAVLRRRLTAWGIMHRYSNLTGRRGERRHAVVIYGPTSSGKTALSLDVCEAASGRGLRPVVLNADSRQVYVGMDIGTSKIKPSQMQGSSTAC